MKKFLAILVSLFFVACVSSVRPVLKPHITSMAQEHAVSIATIYTMDETEYQLRIRGLHNINKTAPRYTCQVIDVSRGSERAIAYLGGGVLLKNNYILSVRHLFVADQNTTGMTIFVFFQHMDHAVGATIVKMTEGKVFHDDYALLALTEDVKLPGLSLAEQDPVAGTPIVFIGSTGGAAWHTRYGFATYADRYFYADDKGVLHLTYWEEFKMLMTFPGGAGDSGGTVINPDGKIVGVMYCGITCRDTEYVFSNPIQLARDFLKANGYEKLL